MSMQEKRNLFLLSFIVLICLYCSGKYVDGNNLSGTYHFMPEICPGWLARYVREEKLAGTYRFMPEICPGWLARYAAEEIILVTYFFGEIMKVTPCVSR